MHFLVDSDADVNILPASSQDKQSMDFKLYAVNGSEIETYGIKMSSLDFGCMH